MISPSGPAGAPRSPATPTLRRRELSSRLRRARQEAGLTIDQVATALEVSSAKISRLETGNRGVQARDVRDLAELYALPQPERDYLIALARSAREADWWQRFDTVLPSAATYLGLETEATSLDWFESQRLPGLFQTPDFTRALLKGINRAETWDPAFIDEQVELRQKRRERLVASPPLVVHAIVDESAVTHRIGSARIMAEQLEQLQEYAGLPNVTIQLLPFDAEAHPGLNGPFTILTLPPERLSLTEVVYIEGNNGEFFHDTPETVTKYRRIFKILIEEALSSQQSLERFQRIGTHWKSQIS